MNTFKLVQLFDIYLRVQIHFYRCLLRDISCRYMSFSLQNELNSVLWAEQSLFILLSMSSIIGGSNVHAKLLTWSKVTSIKFDNGVIEML